MVAPAPRISIISLVYRSSELADWVYESVHKFTPMIARGEAEFFFVANDPTPGLLKHLESRDYPHVVCINKAYTDEELFENGYATPEYMSRVYRGYNEGIRQARGDYVVLINSDNYFSPGWLENLFKYSDRSRVITSTLVEREHPTYSVFPGAVHGEFGDTVESFDEPGFLEFALKIGKTGLQVGGAYMPALLPRDIALEVGLYPCGNVAGASFDQVVRYGDEAFYDTLAEYGVDHYTALDSVVYHLKEGEKDDESVAGDDTSPLGPTADGVPVTRYPIIPSIMPVTDRMSPTKRHDELVGLVTIGQEDKVREQIVGRKVDTEMEAQAQRLRRAVEKVVGPKMAGPTLKLIHSVSWLTIPFRRWLAARRA